MVPTSHFSSRTILGSPKKDVLISGARKNERLYGGKKDDILISYGRNNHLHGGSGADTFAFMANPKRLSRRLINGEISNHHVIHDFDASEGDKIDFSHLLANHKSKAIKIRKNKLRGKGIEIQFSPGSQSIVEKTKKGFLGIEEGIKTSIGEIPEVTHRKHQAKGSKLRIYVDGNLHSEITLKHKPNIEYVPFTVSMPKVSKRQMRDSDPNSLEEAWEENINQSNASQPDTENALEEGWENNILQDFYDQNSMISITPQGIPFYGNGAKLDIKPPIEIFGGVQDWTPPHITVKPEWKPPFAEVKFSFYVNMDLGVNLGPKFTLFTGSIPAKGTLPTWGPSSFNYSESLDLDPPFDVRASGGVGLSGSVDVTPDGLNKSISSEAIYTAQVDFSLSQDGPDISTFTKKTVDELIVGGGSNPENFDSLAGVDAKVTISPNIQFDVGLGVSGDGWHADLIDSGPKVSAPIDIVISGNGKSGVQFNGARLDWVTRLIDIGVKGFSIAGYEWSHDIASMGEIGFIDFSKVCKLEATGASECDY